MHIFLRYPLVLLVFIACSNDDTNLSIDTSIEIPIVQSSQLYNVIVEEDIEYGQGLSHEEINSENSTTVPLKLDVYVPENDQESRPAFMFIHGGGFIGGSKQQSQIINFANFFTSRGWVFISVDYRLRDDKGTVPEAWNDYSSLLEPSQTSQFMAIYPAQRDAKAALRWIVANSDTYNINTDFITVGGGSAGAISAISLGISEEEDFRDELNISQDPTLESTNLDQSYKVQTIIDLWGSKVALDLHEDIYGNDHFDGNDPPLFIVHGTEDPTVLFSNAEELKSIYETIGVPLAYYPIEGGGHGVWNATVNNKRLEQLAFDFITQQQNLVVQ